MTKPELNVKKWMESGEYNDKKTILNREINSNKLTLDRSTFKKTPEEKAQLFNMKQEWKKRQQRNQN